MLFQSVSASNTPIKHGESTFEFIQRDGRQYTIHLRRWIEKWFDDLPSNSKASFKRRLQSRDKENFNSSLFELQVYSLLRRVDCSVDIEPELPETNRRLDLRATHRNEAFFVEATVSGFAQGKFTSSPNEDDAVKKLKKGIPAPHSDIFLDAEGQLHDTLPANVITEPFRKLLRRISADQVRAVFFRDSQADVLSEVVVHSDWRLRGRLSPPISISQEGGIRGPGRVAMCDGFTPLYNSLYKKAVKWKNSDFRGMPFLVAINACHSEFDWYEYDIRRALYANPDSPEGFHRKLSCLSGVIVFDRVFLGNEIGARVKLFRNGDSRIPKCLMFLLEERKLGDLLGIAS